MTPRDEIVWPFAATDAASTDACARAEQWARAAGLPEAQILRLVLIIEELFTNTIKHGYCGESNRPVRIALGLHHGLVELDYRDQGPAFDPVHTIPVLPENEPPAEVGGMGLQLIQSLGDNASYIYEDGWNIVRLTIGAGQTGSKAQALLRRPRKAHRTRP